MNIEYELFKKSTFNFPNLIKYGFIKELNGYKYEINILNNNFKIMLNIIDNKLTSKIIDLNFNDEYLNFKVDSNLSINNKIKEEYELILKDIKEKCTTQYNFIFKQSNDICNYIYKKYKVKLEFLWDTSPDNGVFRNKYNKKWFGIILNVSKNKLDSNYKQEEVEVINIKLNENMINELLKEKGFFKSYHMNKKSWISIILDSSLDNEIIYSLIDQSYDIVNKK